ncbi:MAG: hypothetical protein EPN76_08095 [Burkholderiaceae bacterium]|nr:MAG: hypothetical protein EPN76_08095 [Burkholderiaceae bacterium]
MLISQRGWLAHGSKASHITHGMLHGSFGRNEPEAWRTESISNLTSTTLAPLIKLHRLAKSAIPEESAAASRQTRIFRPACLSVLITLLSAVLASVPWVHAHAAGAPTASLWDSTLVSPAINQGGLDVAVKYTPTAHVVRSGATPVISRVHASFSYNSKTRVSTRLCWDGVERCIVLKGQSINTSVFNGLDARKALYLVYSVAGKGALSPPLFIKGNVIVWFTAEPSLRSH